MKKKVMLIVLYVWVSLTAMASAQDDSGMLERPAFDRDLLSQAFKAVDESLRATLEKRSLQLEIPADSPLHTARNGVHLLLVRDGTVIGDAVARQTSFLGNIRLAAARAIAGQPADAIHGTAIVLTIFLPAISVEGPPLPRRLNKVGQLGMHGIEVEYQGLDAFLPPLACLQENFDWKSALEHLTDQIQPPADAGLSEAEARTERLKRIMSDDFGVRLVPSLTLASLPGKPQARLLVSGSTLVPVAAVESDAVLDALRLAYSWYATHAKQTVSEFNEYDPIRDQTFGKADLERLAQTAWLLARLESDQRVLPQTTAPTLAREVLAVVLERFLQQDPVNKIAYIQGAERASLRASAFALLAIVRSGAHTDDPEVMRRATWIARFLLALRHADGRFDAYYPPERDDVPDGDAAGWGMLALLEWMRVKPDEVLIDQLLDSQQYYSRMFDETQDLRMIPAQTLAAARLYEHSRNEAGLGYMYRMNDLLVLYQQREVRPGGILPEIRRGCFVDGEGRLIGDSIVSKTALALTSVATVLQAASSRQDAKTAGRYATAVNWGLRYLLQSQFRDGYDMLLVKVPDRARGGFRPHMASLRIEPSASADAAGALLWALLAQTDDE